MTLCYVNETDGNTEDDVSFIKIILELLPVFLFHTFIVTGAALQLINVRLSMSIT